MTSPPFGTQNSELKEAALLSQTLTENRDDHEEGTLLR